jgi:hypothetical protein
MARAQALIFGTELIAGEVFPATWMEYASMVLLMLMKAKKTWPADGCRLVCIVGE